MKKSKNALMAIVCTVFSLLFSASFLLPPSSGRAKVFAFVSLFILFYSALCIAEAEGRGKIGSITQLKNGEFFKILYLTELNMEVYDLTLKTVVTRPVPILMLKSRAGDLFMIKHPHTYVLEVEVGGWYQIKERNVVKVRENVYTTNALETGQVPTFT